MMTRIAVPSIVLLAVMSISTLAPSFAEGQQPQRDPQRRGRIFSPKDLGLLEAPDREAWQKPEQVMDALQIAEGSVVADLGAGGGWFTIRLARRVGPHGLVYAEDVQRLMIEAIQRRVEREGLTNVKPVLGEYDDPFAGLPANTLDAVLIVDAFHEMEHPVVLLRNVGRALKASGLIGIIDYRQGEGGPGPDPEDRVAPNVIIQTAMSAGLKLAGEDKFLRYQYFLRFGK
jgi:ubiquinone/menaquinone biosynthesis C-methylase UbiE